MAAPRCQRPHGAVIARIDRVFEGLFAASSSIDLRRLPELFCGFRRQRMRGPTFYPVACTPHAWAAAAPLYRLQACLGLGFDPQETHITFDDPRLPAFLDEVVLRNLSIGEATADVALPPLQPGRGGRRARAAGQGKGGDDELRGR